MADETQLGVAVGVTNGVVVGTTGESVESGGSNLAIGTDNHATDLGGRILGPSRDEIGDLQET
jgi:hypothetical protein